MLVACGGLINQLAQVFRVQSMEHIDSSDLESQDFCVSDCWVLELLIRSHEENLFSNPCEFVSDSKFVSDSLIRI